MQQSSLDEDISKSGDSLAINFRTRYSFLFFTMEVFMELRKAEVFEPKKAGSVLEFIQEIVKTPAQGGQLGKAFDVMKEMFIHKKGFNVLSLAGAMTPAKMSRVIIEMVERKWVHAIVSTGALMAHGLVEGLNMEHYHVPEGITDAELAKRKLNRIYTVLEPEENLAHTAQFLTEHIFPLFSGKDIAPSDITFAAGEHLSKYHGERPSILGACFKNSVAVYIPAWTDSELAIEKMAYDCLCNEAGKRKTFRVVEEIDHRRYTNQIQVEHERGKKLGIFTIGGGVPRNWAQQAGPALEVLEYSLGDELAKKLGYRSGVMFSFGVRITSATPYDMGLSGCTYEEGKSWRKFYPEAKTAELYPCDATLYWPLLVTALAQYEDSLRE